MRVIDAHIHFNEEPYFGQIAKAAGHENSREHLEQVYEQYDIVHGVVMSNRSLDPEYHQYPQFLSYCIGLDSSILETQDIQSSLEDIEKNLRKKQCAGIKLYPGYSHFYIYDPALDPVYELAMKYKKPVAVHMGATATDRALLKYSHPLTMDEAATRHRDVQFVMCHLGNPWIVDAAAVLDKNRNVAADLSGILEGKILDMNEFFNQKSGYINHIKTWLEYVDRYDSLMFGTDWPLANLSNYIEFVKEIIPPVHHDQVFFDNADRIYQLGLR